MRSSGLKLTLCGLFACAAASSNLAAAPEKFERRTSLPALSSDERPASSIPSEERDLMFAQPGLIAEVKVKDGDVVKAGDVLALQDTQVEQAALDKEQFLLKSNVQLRAAEAQRELAEIKLKRKEKLRQKDAASVEEYEEAKLELTVSKLKEELAGEETEAKRLDIVRLQKQIERMKIVAPCDGVIRKVEAGVGEVSDPQKPSILFVVNDPVKIEAKLPNQLASRLQLGQTMQVRYAEEQQWREATLEYFDPYANPEITGGSQLIRLRMDNPEGRRSGQPMVVKLPQDVATAK